ncbi:iron chelate uptake ABC transporter family permease subunit [uncultured Corynebacterium sp.]|uniref:FecCD family ABC transporter permease n=1 Tax=uncultured Corynebacterium sp. TaxID=159447 RepID=UPI00261BA097|nr:iron chelate uptake ABC transporter family permease subunit [uncultured Corynebacterium sp.]
MTVGDVRASISVCGMSAVWRPRPLLATLSLALVVLCLFAAALAAGDYTLPLPTIGQVLLGGGNETDRLVVLEWRMPRAATAVGVGAALGLSGALLQSVTRNPLASPDILGITMGASAAAVTVIAVGTGGASVVTSWLGGLGVSAAAGVGALASALVIWLLALRRKADSFRLVLFGVIINALLQSYVNYLLIRADLRDAQTASYWLTGSLNAANWQTAVPVFVLLAVFAPLLAWISFQFKATELGPDVAASLGQNPRSIQFVFVAASALLAAMAVAAAGPIGFVAFVAPQVALRLCGVSAPPLAASALSGASLVVASDLVTTHALPVALPVGLLTSVLGGSFLVYLLIQTNRRNSI